MSEKLAVGLVLFIVGLALCAFVADGRFSWVLLVFGVPMALVGARMLVGTTKNNG